MRGRAGANDGDVESGRWTAVGRWKWAQSFLEVAAEYVVIILGGISYCRLRRLTGVVERALYRANRRARRARGEDPELYRPDPYRRQADALWSPGEYDSSEGTVPEWERSVSRSEEEEV